MQVLLLQIYYLLTMDKYEPIRIIYTNPPFSEMVDYIYSMANPVQQAMMKIYGITMGDA